MEFEKIRDVIAEQVDGVDKDSITLETTFDSITRDSLDILAIITDLESVFGMRFKNEDTGNINTVGDAVRHVQEALK